MLQPGTLAGAFQTYWTEFENCVKAKAYWSLLHVTVCLPDICSALQSKNGEANANRYKQWCYKFLNHPKLDTDERWAIRNKLLHQGRAIMNKGRYARFSFGQPATTGVVDHMRVEGSPPNCTLHLDVGELASEMKRASEAWIGHIEGAPSSKEAVNVERHLLSLVKVTPHYLSPHSSTGIAPRILKTN